MIYNSDFGPSGPCACIQTYAHLHIKLNKTPEKEKEGRKEEGEKIKAELPREVAGCGSPLFMG